ncbi:TPA: hypothetical protein MH584_16185 [Klebsiella pneumoniae]|nr:hypothetical protein B6J11_15420 [Klebsiella pneumoniae]HBY0358887.1 hypothetical protein [Klebsiella pneumoniae subsp. pneumoniae]HBX2457700.1 hypothetical protein [Klebsiella pneumoniae]HBX4586823.1 hypothetical protein [Klebsiella pneumoniae]HBX4603271.1 hypothetical protein [Klebsiella pneumoniae]
MALILHGSASGAYQVMNCQFLKLKILLYLMNVIFHAWYQKQKNGLRVMHLKWRNAVVFMSLILIMKIIYLPLGICL